MIGRKFPTIQLVIKQGITNKHKDNNTISMDKSKINKDNNKINKVNGFTVSTPIHPYQ